MGSTDLNRKGHFVLQTEHVLASPRSITRQSFEAF